MWFPAIRIGKCLIAAFLVVGLLAPSGCGGSKSGMEQLTMGSVKGKVTLDRGTLPSGCKVSFMHTEKSFPAMAEIGSDGSYTLLFNGKPAVPTGTYEVAIVPPPDETGPAPDPSNPEAYKAVMMNKGPTNMPTSKSAIPGRYRDALRSGLKCTVLEGQETVYDIALTSGS